MRPTSKASVLLASCGVKLARSLLLSVMEDLVGQRPRDGADWLQGMVRGATDIDTFVVAFSRASRHAGRSALDLRPDEADRLRDVGITWSLARWALDDFARAALLLRAGEVLDLSAQAEIVHRGYHQGDTRQRQAVLRALPLLPRPERFLAVAIDAARSGIPPLFEAIACENPYPAAHFPLLNFNLLVLQALMTGTALDRVEGLGARVTPELVRMTNEYAAERRAAGRSVPADLDYIIEAARTAA
jgi:hypothetical protein